MSKPLLRLATRCSDLAMCQTRFVAQQLNALGFATTLVPLSTEGDRCDAPLHTFGGKGVFVKTLEDALLRGDADVAVHSVKDMPTSSTDGLVLHTIMERADPRDAWVGHVPFDPNHPQHWGTGSLRRQSQLQRRWPHVTCVPLRGNVPTRLVKLQDPDNGLDGLVLAAAGLERLGLGHRIAHRFPTEVVLPCAGQGAIGLECRADDTTTQGLLAPLNHPASALCVHAERSINRALGGHCHTPLATYASWRGDLIHLETRVGDPQGHTTIQAEATVLPDDLETGVVEVVEALNAQGAQGWLT